LQSHNEGAVFALRELAQYRFDFHHIAKPTQPARVATQFTRRLRAS
jgi:hypothetical protein